jgi:hypothetical protein
MDEELRSEILRRFEVDQEARRRIVELMREGGSGSVPMDVGREMQAIDADNTAWLRGVIHESGWPGRSRVGEEAANAAWLLVQHADADRDFQHDCLELLREAVETGEASPKNLAYLTDRVLVADGKPQRYGTQFTSVDGRLEPQPLEAPARVDDLRAGVGLSSLEEYARLIREMHSVSG